MAKMQQFMNKINGNGDGNGNGNGKGSGTTTISHSRPFVYEDLRGTDILPKGTKPTQSTHDFVKYVNTGEGADKLGQGLGFAKAYRNKYLKSGNPDQWRDNPNSAYMQSSILGHAGEVSRTTKQNN